MDDPVWRYSLDSLPVAIALVDAVDSTTLWANDAFVALFADRAGGKPILGAHPATYVPQLDADQWSAAVRAEVDAGSPHVESACHQVHFVDERTHDEVYWEWSVRAVGPARACLLLRVETVTARVLIEIQSASAARAAERARRRTEAMIRLTQLVTASLTPDEVMRAVTREAASFCETSYACVLLLTPDRRHLRIGYGMGLLQEQPGSERLLPYEATLAAQALTRKHTLVMPDIRDLKLETAILADGSRPIAIASSPIWKDDRAFGALNVYFRVPRDLSGSECSLLSAFAHQAAISLHRAELYDEISAQRRRLQSIFDHAPVAITYFDANGRVEDVNATAAIEYGRAAEGIHGLHFTELTPDLPADLFERAYAGRPFHASHHTHQGASGEETVSDISIVPIRSGTGRVGGVLLLSFDVTEPSRAREAAIRALSEARSAQHRMVQLEKMQAIGELASGVEHDFNNALMAILGHAELAEDNLDDVAEVADHLGTIKKATEDAAATVRRLQAFARQSSSMKPARTDVGTVIEDVVQLTRPRWKDAAQKDGRRYDVRVEIEPSEPIFVDAGALREALVNMIHNALEAMPSGGVLTLSTRPCGSDEVEITVADTGVGITPNVASHMFDPFFTTRGIEGTGLGLAVSRSIVQAHGGTITLDTRPGEGARFIIRLPVRRPPDAAAMAVTSGNGATVAGARVLIVDDEKLVASVLNGILSRHGFDACVDHSAEQAIERMRIGLESFDVVITDHGLPGMTGLQLVAELKRLSPKLPVVMLTGWGANVAPEDPSAPLPDVVLRKPINQRDLLDAVGHALSSAPPTSRRD